MAYVSKEKKAKICAALKLVVPKGWKYTVSVSHYSTLNFNLAAAPIDLITEIDNKPDFANTRKYFELRQNQIDKLDLSIKTVLKDIFNALNVENFDDSDIQSDYFHVGHYVKFNVGKFDKPFSATNNEVQA